MKKPNLFIVGQSKSGTTALHCFLDQHPDIYMSTPKEVYYFCKDFHEKSDSFHKRKIYFLIREEEQYLKLFSKSKGEKVLGEATPFYIYSKVAAKEIHKFNPDAKIIILLRNPVDVLYSIHNQLLNNTEEDTEDFKSALSIEKDRISGKHLPSTVRCPVFLYYSQRIKYYEQVKRYYNLFPKSNIKVFIFEDFKDNNYGICKETLKFLGVNSNFIVDFKTVNASKKPRYKKLHRFLFNSPLRHIYQRVAPPKWHDRIKNLTYNVLMKEVPLPPMDHSLKLELMKEYKQEVVKISNFLNIDLERKWGYDQIE